MQRLSIAILCHAGMGGSGILAATLALRMAERGHRVHLLTTQHPFRIRKVPDNLQLEIVNVPQFEMLPYPQEAMSLAGRLSQLAQRTRFDIIHSHFLFPFAVCAEMARQLACLQSKLVITLHGTDVTQLGHVEDLRPTALWALRQADAVTCVSAALRKLALQTFSGQLSLQTIYNFLPERHPRLTVTERAELRNHLGLSPDERVLIHASNFRAVKRLSDIIDAFYKVRQQHACKLVLLGDGPLWEQSRQRVQRLGLEADVRMPGRVTQCARWLGCGDLALQLSSEESFGLVLLEALSQGVPVVATRVGGMPEVIRQGINGQLCEPCSPDDAASQIGKLLAHPQQLQQLAANAEQSIRHFSEASIVSQYEALYQRLLSEPAVTARAGTSGDRAGLTEG